MAQVAVAQNLVVNGGFTSNAASFVTWPGYVGSGSNPTNVPGWSQVAGSAGGYGVNGAGAVTSIFGPASSGANTFLFIQGSGKQLAQTLPALTTNASYVLSFKVAARNQTDAAIASPPSPPQQPKRAAAAAARAAKRKAPR